MLGMQGHMAYLALCRVRRLLCWSVTLRGSCTSSTWGTWLLPGSRMPNVELEMDLADLYMAIGVWLTLE